jgi:hypothetical protein
MNLTDICLGARQRADYQGSSFVDDSTELNGYANDVGSELFDEVNAVDESYFINDVPYPFTLTSSPTGNSINTLSLPGGCYKIFKLWYTQGTTGIRPQPVLRGNWSELYSCRGRRHFWGGNILQVQDWQGAGGNYALQYVPFPPVLAFPTVMNMATGSNTVVASTGVWTFANATFDQTFAGSTLTIQGATNNGNNSSFPILQVTSPTTVVTATTGLTSETFSTVVAANFQPAGTVYTIPDKVAQWGEFYTVGVAIRILTKAKEPMTELQAAKERLLQRIQSLAHNRDSEAPQVSIVEDGAGSWRDYDDIGGW